MAWTLERGEIPDGLQVLHHCDNPPCVNVEHLFLGTPGDNARDRDAKHRRPISEAFRRIIPPLRTKLTADEVESIRALYATGAYRQIDLAGMFAVSRSNIQAIVSGRTWYREWHGRG